MGRCVAALVVGGAHLLCRESFLAEQAVHERRLSHPRGAEQHHAGAGSKIRRERVDALPCMGTQCEHCDIRSRDACLFELALQRFGQVELAQHDHTPGAPSRASVRMRSMRRGLKSRFAEHMARTVSTFAARSCPRVGLSDAFRTRHVRRGNTW